MPREISPAKLLRALFWLNISAMFCAVCYTFFDVGMLPDNFPGLHAAVTRRIYNGLNLLGAIGTPLCSIAEGCVLLILSCSVRKYVYAAALTFLPVAINSATYQTMFAGYLPPMTLLQTASTAFGIAAMGFECSAHGELLESASPRLAKRWRRLWKVLVPASALASAGTLGTQYIGGIAWTLAALVGYMTVTAPGIIRLVRLRRSAKVLDAAMEV